MGSCTGRDDLTLNFSKGMSSANRSVPGTSSAII